MKKSMYCFNCDKDVEYEIVNEKREYTIHNKKIVVDENVIYCLTCHNELIDENLNTDLNNIYNEYLKIYDLSFDKFKEIRKSLNLSQELFAKALGWSKKTVVRYENKQSLPQIEYLYVYKKILNNKMEFLNILEERKERIDIKDYNNILSKVSLDIDLKTLNVFLYILKDNNLSITQIMKNLFAIDFYSYKEINNPITNLLYVHAPYGPIVNNRNYYIDILVKNGYINIIIDNNDNLLFKANKEYDINIFNAKEIEILNLVKRKLKNKTAKELTEWSHKFKGWIDTNDGKIIDYKYAKYLNL